MGLFSVFTDLFKTVTGNNAAKRQAESNDKMAEATLEAARIAAEAAGKPQITHSTTEEIVHKSPVEIGSAGVQGFDLANQWANMMAQSANAGAMENPFEIGSNSINMGRKSLLGFDALSSGEDGDERDAEYASYDMQRKARQGLTRKIDVYGIDDGSGRNPGGAKISLQEYIQVRRAKDPSAFISEGRSISDPIQDDEWGAVASMVAKGDTDPVWVKRYQLVDMLANDPQLGGDGLAAMAADPGWAEAIGYWKTQGVINSQNLPNQGQLQKHYKNIQDATLEHRTMGPGDPETMAQIKKDYARLAGTPVDKKLIRETELSDGVRKIEKLNPDGSVAVSILSGSITFPNGEVRDDVEIQGFSLDDWEEFSGTAKRTGALFSGKKVATGAYTKSSNNPDSKDSSKKPPGYSGASLAAALEEATGQELTPEEEAMLEEMLAELAAAQSAQEGEASSAPSRSVDMAPPGYEESGARPLKAPTRGVTGAAPTTAMPEPYRY